MTEKWPLKILRHQVCFDTALHLRLDILKIDKKQMGSSVVNRSPRSAQRCHGALISLSLSRSLVYDLHMGDGLKHRAFTKRCQFSSQIYLYSSRRHVQRSREDIFFIWHFTCTYFISFFYIPPIFSALCLSSQSSAIFTTTLPTTSPFSNL